MSDVVRVIEASVNAPVTLVGQSMGGHTAMLLTAARPDLVSKLVLLESGPGSGSAAKNERIGDFFRSYSFDTSPSILDEGFPSRRTENRALRWPTRGKVPQGVWLSERSAGSTVKRN